MPKMSYNACRTSKASTHEENRAKICVVCYKKSLNIKKNIMTIVKESQFCKGFKNTFCQIMIQIM